MIARNPNYNAKRVIHIIPATDWHAVHTEERLYVPLAAWALVEYEDGTQAVVGIEASPFDPNTDFSEDFGDFQGYVYRPADTTKMIPEHPVGD